MKEINSLYIHFPFCQHLCNYCDFYKHKLEDEKQVIEFEEKLIDQINFHKSFLEKKNFEIGELDSVYLGGGTPSLWKLRGPEFIKRHFLKDYRLSKNCEFTMEIDPDTWSEEEIERWQSIGVNRFSIGSQAYSEKYIKIMDRTHNFEDVEKTIKYFSDRSLNFSVDLMLGLPKASEKRDVESELSALLAYKPNHFSVYILKTRSNYPLKKFLPDDEDIREEYLKVSSFLKKHGYDHYEVSNFARDGFYSKHNRKYWDYQSVAAIGPNATGLLVGDGDSIRYQWKSVSLGVTEEVLSGSSLIIEKLFLGLRHKNDFDITRIFNKSEEIKELGELLINWKRLNYVEESSELTSINLTPYGYLMCDSLLDDVFKRISF